MVFLSVFIVFELVSEVLHGSNLRTVLGEEVVEVFKRKTSQRVWV